MKKVYSFLIIALFTLPCYGQAWEWAKGITMPYLPYYLFGVQISSESSGNFYVSGFHWDSNYGYPAGSCIIKFDSVGNEKWRKLLNDKIRIYKIQTDGNGNLLVAGDFMDTINLNGLIYTSQSETDGFLLSLDSTGTTNWFKQISGPRDENAQDIYLDKKGNLFLTGKFSNQTNIDGIVLNTIGSCSSYILKFNINGTLLSSITSAEIDTIGYNSGYRIQADDTGNLYLLSNYNVMKYDTMSLNNTTYGGGEFIAKIDSTGEVKFLKYIISGTENFKNFRATKTGLYFTGDGGWTNGCWTKTERYSLNGNLIWSNRLWGYHYGYSSNKIVENDNGFYTIGYESNPNVPSWIRTYALMISNLDTNGQESITRINSIGRVEGYDIAKTGNNEFLIIGLMPDTITFGNTMLTNNQGNIFIAKFKGQNMTSLSEELSLIEKVIIFPNPTSGQFTLQLNEQIKNGKVCVYNVLGNCILTQKIKNSINLQLDLSSQPKGIYFIEIDTGKEKLNKKIMLQ